MIFGMIRLMQKLFIFIFALAFSLNLSAREETILDSGWKFKLGDPGAAQNMKFGEFSDKFWQTVSVPHCCCLLYTSRCV